MSKVLKPNERLPFMRLDIDDEIPARWFEDENSESNDADEKTESDDIQ